MRVLGISLGHDSNLALVEGGRLRASLEAERRFRQKRYKLDCASLEPGRRESGYQYVDVAELEEVLSGVAGDWGPEYDAVAVQNQERRAEYENLLALLRRLGFRFGEARLLPHHLCHAALGFYTSPFREALVFSYDGYGSDGCTVVFAADGREGLRYLEDDPTRFGQGYNNLGYIAGIRPEVCGTSSGKTMGLAAYGRVREEWLPSARRYVRDYRKLPRAAVAGLHAFGAGHRIGSPALDEIPELAAHVVQAAAGAPPAAGLRRWLRRPAARELRLPGPESPLAQDLVATVQRAWTEVALAILARHRERSRSLCVAGGCALNGVTNRAILESGLFERVHFVPNPSDCGLAAGAALHLERELSREPFEGAGEALSPFLGAEPFDLARLPALGRRFPSLALEPGDAPRALAELLARGLVVGVIRGRYEVGPRALGHRSILCNPLLPHMRDTLNQKVKHREWYRPFAPVAPAEVAGKYFDTPCEVPYMSVVCHTLPAWRERLPAVTHVDGSARLQTLRRDSDPFLHRTLLEFERRAGLPVLLNTSFNPKGEPILNFCEVGLEMLEKTDLDLVLVGETLHCKPGREELLRGL
jgi:carbamoyltransferase